MKTTIIDDLELDAETREALTREAVRQRRPVADIIRDELIALARAINGNGKPARADRKAVAA